MFQLFEQFNYNIVLIEEVKDVKEKEKKITLSESISEEEYETPKNG
jgi:hypothetical protein